MLEVFLCRIPGDPQRNAWLFQVWQKWISYDCRVAILQPEEGESAQEFQRMRRLRADAIAHEKIYVVADDDCLPLGENFLEEMLRLTESHPYFAILAPLPENETIVEWTPADHETASDEEVMEHVSVGGIRFCHRGCMYDAWPKLPVQENGYDGIHCEHLRELGWRVGYARHVHFTHLGKGKSTVWT